MSQQAADIRTQMESAGVRVGTSMRTKFMRGFIAETDAKGQYVFDIATTLDRIAVAGAMMARTGAADVIACTAREHARTPVARFCEVTGARPLLGRFMPGTLTNPSLSFYIEPRLVLVSDPQVDAQAVTEATNAGIPVIGLADTDNITSRMDLVIPANNRGRKALAAAYWLLARQTLAAASPGGDDAGFAEEHRIEDFEDKSADPTVEQ